MNRWEKIGQGLLLTADALRLQNGSTRHLSAKLDTLEERLLEKLDKLDTKLDEIHASHQKIIRFQAETDARLTRLERGPSAAE
jgi:hypothetical protein